MNNEELIALYKSGDIGALEQIIIRNERLVNYIVNRCTWVIREYFFIELSDLQQEGFIGLILAVDKYDLTRKDRSSFATFAFLLIKQRVLSYIKKTYKNKNDVSLYSPMNDEKVELVDTLESDDNHLMEIEESIYNDQLKEELEDVMRRYLTLKEYQVLELRYGLDGDDLTLEDIARLFGRSKEGIRKTEQFALKKLRKSPWGVNKAKEEFREKYITSEVVSINGVINKLDFIDKYF